MKNAIATLLLSAAFFAGLATSTTGAADHPIFKGVTPAKWHTKGSVYLVAPMLDKKATVLMTATTEGKVEPVTWTRDYGKSRVFYTSLGHPDDFDLPQFRTMLTNGIFWAMNRPVGK